MSDVLFRYLLGAREHDRSWLQRAFLSDERRLAAGIERVVETAAIRLEVVSQHERVTIETQTVPQSQQSRVPFVDVPGRNRPEPGHPVTRTDRYPLRSTLKIRDCVGCRGTGKTACPDCDGSGVGKCYACFSENLDDGCPVCRGVRRWPCGDCHTTGLVRHAECAGEGRFATWDVEVHTYTARVQADTFFPEEAPDASRAAVAVWLERHREYVSELLPPSPDADTPELASMIRRVEMRRATYQHVTRHDPEYSLFTEVRYSVVPMSACFARSEVTGRQMASWLVGRGTSAIEIPPAQFVDPWKTLSWPGLIFGSTSAAEAWLQLHGASLALPVAATSPFVPAALGAGAAAGIAAAAVGLRRVLAGRRRPVRTIAVLSCSGEPSLYLLCLAALGSHVGALEVLDRVWRNNLESLLGEAPASSFSRTLGLRTERGESVRLIEVANPQGLTPDEARRMTEASQGILFLETPENLLDSLRSHIHAATVARPTELRLVLDSSATEADAHGRTPEDRLALEAIRHAFIGEGTSRFDWSAVFAELWGPVSALLSEREGLRPRSLRLTSPAQLAARARG